MLGLEVMPWQQHVFDVAGEYDDAGRPYYSEVVYTVPRQSGKTTVELVIDVHRCVLWDRQPQRVAYTAQSGQDARNKWLKDLFPMIERSQMAPAVAKITRANGNEAIEFTTGGRIDILSSSESAGHGLTLHMANLDELFHDKDHRREQSLRPAMITVPDRQLLVCSTAGTQTSKAWNRKLRNGRKAAKTDKGTGMAFFEWSAPDDGWDPEDEASWWAFMPALGHTISVDAIRAELEGMDRDEFRRAYGNLTSQTAATLIPGDAWASVSGQRVRPVGPFVWAVDVSPDRTSAAIAVAGVNGCVELVEHRAGTAWVVDRMSELESEHGGRVVRHRQSPAGALPIAAGIEDLGTEDVARCCGRFYDAILDSAVDVWQHPALDMAAAGAVRKEVGDQFMFSRKASSEDASPLLAAAIALGSVLAGEPEPVSDDFVVVV